MVSAEIIAIGTELLLGEILDTNTRFLARQLQQIGVNVFRASIVGDNTIRIADAIRESLGRSNIVITSGGLGPTVDDPTRDAVAIAFNVENEFQPELWQQIETRFNNRGLHPTENNRRQAYIPKGAVGIPNSVGTAPAFYMKRNEQLLFSLPGVPSELEFLYKNAVVDILKENFHLAEVIKTRVIHTSGIGESVVDTLIGDLELLTNPTVGLAAHPGVVDIRITARAASAEAAEKSINQIASIIFSRLSDSIFGYDEESLVQVISQKLKQINLPISCEVFGIDASLFEKNILPGNSFFKLHLLGKPYARAITPINHQRDLLFGVNLYKSSAISRLDLFFQSGDVQKEENRTYSGPPDQVDLWALNNNLDFIWKKIRN